MGKCVETIHPGPKSIRVRLRDSPRLLETVGLRVTGGFLVRVQTEEHGRTHGLI